METPDIYVASRAAFDDARRLMIPYSARLFAQARRVKVLDFLTMLHARAALAFPLLVEGLDDLILYVLPEEREAVLQRMRKLMSSRLSQDPKVWVVFLLRQAELAERASSRTVELVRGGDRVPLHPAFPTSRWQMAETNNGKPYLRVGGLGS